jgi:hypothetical protein
MTFVINGLRIAVVDGAGKDAPASADVVWRRTRTDDLVVPEDQMTSGSVWDDIRPDGLWTARMDGQEGQANCIFSVSPDGRQVISRSRPFVADEDLLGLFTEPVMRIVLHRRGHSSFHAAALMRDGSAVLIMGEKGAGKSTLSAALQTKGWTLLADDLVRVEEAGGVWCALPGHRRSKLHEEVLEALDIDPATLPLRWTMFSAPSEKRLFNTPDDGLDMVTGVPISAVWLVQPRSAGAAEVRLETVTDAAAALTLLANATPHPVTPATMPAPALVKAVQGLMRQAAISRVTLPDELGLLLKAADSLAAALPSAGR